MSNVQRLSLSFVSMVSMVSMVFFTSLFASCVTSKDAPQKVAEEGTPFTASVITAWTEAGALTGWLAQTEMGEWRYLENKPEDVGSLPVFLWPEFKAGVMAKLPMPTVPFAIGAGATTLDNAGLKELTRFQNLRSIDLSHTRVTDDGLGQLVALPMLTSVDLGASSVTDAGLKELAKIKSLKKLYFGSTAVTDLGVGALAALPDLRTLYLYKTSVSDAGLEKLAGLKKLEILILIETNVTEQGLAAFQLAHPELRAAR